MGVVIGRARVPRDAALADTCDAPVLPVYSHTRDVTCANLRAEILPRPRRPHEEPGCTRAICTLLCPISTEMYDDTRPCAATCAGRRSGAERCGWTGISEGECRDDMNCCWDGGGVRAHVRTRARAHACTRACTQCRVPAAVETAPPRVVTQGRASSRVVAFVENWKPCPSHDQLR